MKKHLIMTTAMAGVILTASGCGSAPSNGWDDADVLAQRDTQICVNKDGERVYDDLCDDDRHHSGNGFFWYYLGRNSAVPYHGDSINNPKYAGSFKAAPGTSYFKAPSSTAVTRSIAVSRGGFGSSSHSFGGARS